MKSSQEQLIASQQNLKNTSADSGEVHESTEAKQAQAEKIDQMTSKLGEFITESSRKSNENIARLTEQQETMLHEIKSLDQRNESLDTTVSDSRMA